MHAFGAREWRGVWLGLGLLVGGSGCGGEWAPPPPRPLPSPVAAPAPPDGGNAAAPVPPPDAGQAQPDPAAAFAELPAPVCVPEPVHHREATACLRTDLRPTGLRASSERFDARGRTLERAYYDEQGRPSLRISHTYAGDHEVRRVQHYEERTTTTRWEYDSAGRQTRVEERHTAPRTEPNVYASETHYDARGRTALILHLHNAQPDGHTLFEYDAQGLLTRTLRLSGDGDTRAETVFTHHPNGQLHEVAYRPFTTMGGETEETYDAQGRLLLHTWCTHKACNTSTYVYDAAGRQTVHHYLPGGDLTGSSTLRTRYDAAGRRLLQQRVDDIASIDTPGPHAPRTETRRFLYTCGNGALVREELDVDGDGSADGLRELDRDARGRVVRERFTGALRTSELAVREYRYDCAAP
jgi:YD repeat-containing protein